MEIDGRGSNDTGEEIDEWMDGSRDERGGNRNGGERQRERQRTRRGTVCVREREAWLSRRGLAGDKISSSSNVWWKKSERIISKFFEGPIGSGGDAGGLPGKCVCRGGGGSEMVMVGESWLAGWLVNLGRDDGGRNGGFFFFSFVVVGRRCSGGGFDDDGGTLMWLKMLYV